MIRTGIHIRSGEPHSAVFGIGQMKDQNPAALRKRTAVDRRDKKRPEAQTVRHRGKCSAQGLIFLQHESLAERSGNAETVCLPLQPELSGGAGIHIRQWIVTPCRNQIRIRHPFQILRRDSAGNVRQRNIHCFFRTKKSARTCGENRLFPGGNRHGPDPPDQSETIRKHGKIIGTGWILHGFRGNQKRIDDLRLPHIAADKEEESGTLRKHAERIVHAREEPHQRPFRTVDLPDILRIIEAAESAPVLKRGISAREKRAFHIIAVGICIIPLRDRERSAEHAGNEHGRNPARIAPDRTFVHHHKGQRIETAVREDRMRPVKMVVHIIELFPQNSQRNGRPEILIRQRSFHSKRLPVKPLQTAIRLCVQFHQEFPAETCILPDGRIQLPRLEPLRKLCLPQRLKLPPERGIENSPLVDQRNGRNHGIVFPRKPRIGIHMIHKTGNIRLVILQGTFAEKHQSFEIPV